MECQVSKINVSYCKGNLRPTTGHEGPEGEQKYNPTLSLTPALDGDGWLTPPPAALSPGNRPGAHFTGGCMGLGVELEG